MNVIAKPGTGQRPKGVLTVTAAIVVLCFCAILFAPAAHAQDTPPPASPQTTTSSSTDTSQGTGSGAGMQVASALATMVYFPFKAAFAIGGGIVGGLAYAFSGGNETTAKSIWQTSAYGTYLITPEHLSGDKPVRFLGVPAQSDSGATATAEPSR